MLPRQLLVILTVAGLLAGCGPNALRPTGNSYVVPLALASSSSQTAEFSLPSARYGVYLVHQASCPATRLQHPEHAYERDKDKIDCDLAVTIHRFLPEGPILLDQHLNVARFAWSTSDEAAYDLGYFETAERGKVVMTVTNIPGQHDDSVCHARVEVREIFRK